MTIRRRTVNPQEPLPPLTFANPQPILPFGNTDPHEPPSRVITTLGTKNVFVPIIYGKLNTGGIIIWEGQVLGSSWLSVYLVGWGPVNRIYNVRFDDSNASFLNLTYNIHTGSAASNSAVDSLLTTYAPYVANWTSRLPGLAYVVVLFNPPTNSTPAPDPHSFTCEVEGLMVRDHRADPTLVTRYYSDNVALCRADFWTSNRYGAGRLDTDIDWATVDTAADDCDFNIGGGVKRFRIAMKMAQRKDFAQCDDNLRICGQLFDGFANGKHQMFVDKAQTPTSIVLTDQGTSANIISAALRDKEPDEVPNRVKISYTELIQYIISPEANKYKQGEAQTEAPGIGTGSILDIVEVTFNPEGIPTFDQAKRISIWAYNRGLLDSEAVIDCAYEGAVLITPGCVITVTSSDLDWSNQLCIVKKVTPNEGGFQIIVELYSSSTYSDTPQTTYVTPYPTGITPLDIVEWPLIDFVADGNGIVKTGGPTTGYKFFVNFVPPQIRTRILYGASAWSVWNTGTINNAAAINDGTIGSTGATLPQFGGLKVDLGTPKTIREIEVTHTSIVSGALDNPVRFVTFYSDDNVNFFSSGNNRDSAVGYDGTLTGSSSRYISQIDASALPHRYWGFELATPTTISIKEFQLFEYTGAYPFVQWYKIYDLTVGPTPLLIGYYPATHDFIANPIFIPATSIKNVPSVGPTFFYTAIRVVAVSQDGVESKPLDGIRYFGYSTPTTNYMASASMVGVETILNKTLDDSNTITVKDSLFTIEDNLDITKKTVFQLSGLTPATTKTLTVPDANITLAGREINNLFSADQTFNGFVAMNMAIDTAVSLSIKGRTTNSTGYALATYDSSANVLMYVRNDGHTHLRTLSANSGFINATISMLSLMIPYNNNDFANIDFIYDGNGLPIARIGTRVLGTGSQLWFGTSNSYNSGVTNVSLIIDATGAVNIANQGVLNFEAGASGQPYWQFNQSNVAKAYAQWITGSRLDFWSSLGFKIYGGNVGFGDAPSNGSGQVQVITTSATAAFIGFAVNSVFKGYLGSAGTTNDLVIGSAASDLAIRTNSAKIIFSTDSGSSIMLRLSAKNMGLGTSDFGSGSLVFALANAVSNPSVNPTGGGVLYVNAGALTWLGSSGTITTVAPADPHCANCGGDVNIKEAVNADHGYHSICLYCLGEFLEEKYGDLPFIIKVDAPTKKPKLSNVEALKIRDSKKLQGLERIKSAKLKPAIDVEATTVTEPNMPDSYNHERGNSETPSRLP